MIRRALISAFLLLGSTLGWAQTDMLVEAFRKYQEGALNEARALVDEAVELPAHQADPEAWLLRGFIYKDLFKSGADDEKNTFREEAINSLGNTLDLDSAGQYKENALQAYDFLARTYFNDAARALNDMRPEDAEALYLRFSQALSRMGKEDELGAKDIEFNNALGTVYTKLYNRDREAIAWYDKAVNTYRLVLEKDPENYGANYNLATLYYNRGVYNIQRIDAHSDIQGIQSIQDVSREFFLEALPFMLKAFEMDPDRKETLLGLEGIYYSLQDPGRSEHFRELYEKLAPEDGR